MYVEERDGKYRYVERYVDYRTGKTRRVSVTLERNTASARREARRLLDEKIAASEGAVPSKELTVGRAVEMYLEYQKATVKDSTRRRNSFSLKKATEALGTDTVVSRLDAGYVRRKLMEACPIPTDYNETLRRFKAFIRWCYKSDIVESAAYLDKLEPLKVQKKKEEEKYLEGRELEKLLPELTVDINRYAVEFLALSGLRIGELIALERRDADLKARVIHVTKTYDVVNGIVTSTKTDASRRDVFIQEELLRLIKEIRAYYRAMGVYSVLFMPTLKGGYLRYYALNKYFKENCERVLGRPLTLHSLRHTHASLLFERGMPLEAVSLRLGHADSRVTKEIYLHITERKREEYDARLDGISLLGS